MATVLIAGASGVVGQRTLQRLLASEKVERVIAVGRRPLAVEDPKLISLVADLNQRADLLAKVQGRCDVAICALGTTIKQAGSKEAFRRVDHDAVVTFAEAALDRGAQRLLLVSSIGANAKSSTFYLRVKGETEADLAKLGFSNLTIVRPSFIDPQGTRPEHRRGEEIALPLAKAFFSVFARHTSYAPITADAVARALTRLAFDPTTERLRILQGKPLFQAAA